MSKWSDRGLPNLEVMWQYLHGYANWKMKNETNWKMKVRSYVSSVKKCPHSVSYQCPMKQLEKLPA